MASDLIGIVVGLRAEARIARRTGWLVAIGGGTPVGAAAAARELIAWGATALVSFGLAGGLDPALRAGDVVIPSFVLAGAARFSTDPTLAARFGRTDGRTLLCAGEAVATAADKARLFATTSASAVDLESGPVAELAGDHGLRFAAVRAICDPAGRSLPPAALLALDGRGVVSLLRVLGSVTASPGQLPALFALARDAAAARRALLRAIPSPDGHVRNTPPFT